MPKKEEAKREPAELVWEGDSRDVVRGFPDDIKKKLGEDIRRLQQGVRPLDYRPMPSIGRGVAELRQRDANGWYRTIYLSVENGVLHILHSFIKKSAKTPQKDLNTAEARLKELRARQLREKKDAKRDSVS